MCIVKEKSYRKTRGIFPPYKKGGEGKKFGKILQHKGLYIFHLTLYLFKNPELPLMIKLLPLILEKIIQVPQSLMDQVFDLYDYIEENKDRIMRTLKNYGYFRFSSQDPVGILKVQPIKGEAFSITVILTYEEHGASDGFYDSDRRKLFINLGNIESRDHFSDIVRHELVHVMDPKTSDEKMSARYPSLGPEGPTTEFLRKYFNSPEEFDAFSSERIHVFKRNLERYPDIDPKKLLRFLAAIEKKAPKEVYNASYSDLIPLFNPNPVSNPLENKKHFNGFMFLLKHWRQKPTLYRQFLKRAYLELIK